MTKPEQQSKGASPGRALHKMITSAGVLVSVTGFALALTFQVVKTGVERRHVAYMQVHQALAEIEAFQTKQTALLKQLNALVSAPPPGTDLQRINSRVDELQADISRVRESTLGLRQAINPQNPEEVLTIARLRDQLVSLSSKFESLKKHSEKEQVTFRDAVARELAASNKATNLVLVILLPLIANFLYSVWKDMKKNRAKKDAQPEDPGDKK